MDMRKAEVKLIAATFLKSELLAGWRRCGGSAATHGGFSQQLPDCTGRKAGREFDRVDIIDFRRADRPASRKALDRLK
jgi:hypothetical protein